jgi:hypothetical protein
MQGPIILTSKREDAAMDFPFYPDDSAYELSRRRGPVDVWALLAVIGLVLCAAALGAASVTDTRDFAARHHSVLATQSL